jgi:hypothetical protein
MIAQLLLPPTYIHTTLNNNTKPAAEARTYFREIIRIPYPSSHSTEAYAKTQWELIYLTPPKRK